jgi:cyclopropane-fatty-acyl-phospholipid synthase
VNAATQGRFTVEGVENHSARTFSVLVQYPQLSLALSADYPRTLREWDKRFVTNVTPKILAKDFPSAAMDPANFEMLCRKWRYLFAYASAGMGSGYVTCHMFTFIRSVCILVHPTML